MVIILINLMIGAAWAGSGHGPMTLIAPAVNLGLLIGLLIYKTRKPLSDFFSNQAKEITQTLDRANLKSKEAQVLLDNQERKLNNLAAEIREINAKTEQDIKQFESSYQQEINAKITKLKSDAVFKMESDKKQITNELNAKIINQIIAKTKNKISSSTETRNKASSSMMKGLN